MGGAKLTARLVVGQLLQVVTDLYHLRDHLPGGGLGFEPWAGQAALGQLQENSSRWV